MIEQCCEVPSKCVEDGTIEAKCDGIARQLDYLREAVGCGADRLSPILVPATPILESDCKVVGESNARSELYYLLDTYETKILQIRQELESIIGRVNL